MNDGQQKQASQMLEEGKSYREIATELENDLTWNDIQDYAWKTETLSWQGAKKSISIRLKRFATATQEPVRVELADEIDQFVEYLYYCARKIQDRIDSARKVLA